MRRHLTIYILVLGEGDGIKSAEGVDRKRVGGGNKEGETGQRHDHKVIQ